MKYNVVKPGNCEHSGNPKGHIFWSSFDINEAYRERAGITNLYKKNDDAKNCPNCEMVIEEVN